MLVLVDFPKEAEHRNQVENHARNRQIAEHFGVIGFPTIVLADAQGRPYGVQGYVHGGVSAFLQHVRRHQAARQRRDRAMASVQSAAGTAKLAAIRGCLDVLEENDLLPFYSDVLKEWTQMALSFDPRNQHGVYERVFQCRWMAQLQGLDKEDEQGLVRLAAALDNWKRQCDFRDPERGAVLHLLAGVCLLQAGEAHFADAARHFKARGKYNPQDAQVAERLELLSALGDDHLAGTGFVVSSDG